MAAVATASATNNGGGNSVGQDSYLTAVPGHGACSKRSCVTAATAAAWHSLGQHLSSPSLSYPSAARLNDSSGNRGKKSPGPTGVKVGMEAGVWRCTHYVLEKTL
uniref:Uncharacterized protein n=1 Tax=Oryza meridionalis TaxID=40149 RepID=A0A0E0DPJ4_9ORYZ